MRSARALTILALLAHAARARVVKSPNLTKHVNYNSRQELTFTYAIGENTTLAYALCEPAVPSASEYAAGPRVKCVLTLEVESRYGDVARSSCPAYLAPRRRCEADARRYALDARYAHRGQLILAWRQAERLRRRGARWRAESRNATYLRETVKVRVIDMRSCRYRQTELSAGDALGGEGVGGGLDGVNVVPHDDDTFRVYYGNLLQCGEKRKCSVEYSFKRRSFGVPGTVPTLPLPYDVKSEILPLVTSSNSTPAAYVLSTRRYEHGVIDLVSPAGELLYRHRYSWSPFETPAGVGSLAISSAHGRLGICQRGAGDAHLDCSLFERTGNASLGVSVTLKSRNVTATRMLNTGDGGFLALVGYAGAAGPRFDALDVLKVDAKGWLEEVHEKGRVDCDFGDSASVDVGLIPRTGFRHCYYVACSRTDLDGVGAKAFRLKLTSECYPIDEEAKNSYYYWT